MYRLKDAETPPAVTPLDKRVNEKFIQDFEATTIDYYVSTSRARREAQAKLIEKYPTLSANEAHKWLRGIRTIDDGSQFSKDVFDISMEYGYRIDIYGLSFEGYARGPLTIGDNKSQQLAIARGALLSNGVLPEDTYAAAERYGKYVLSFYAFEIGTVVTSVRVLDPELGKESEVEIKVSPPEAEEEIREAIAEAKFTM